MVALGTIHIFSYVQFREKILNFQGRYFSKKKTSNGNGTKKILPLCCEKFFLELALPQATPSCDAEITGVFTNMSSTVIQICSDNTFAVSIGTERTRHLFTSFHSGKNFLIGHIGPVAS